MEVERSMSPMALTKIVMASAMSQTKPCFDSIGHMGSHDSIYHLVEHGPWISGKVYAPPSLQTEGFIHLSTREQLLGTLKRFFGHTQSMLIVEVSSALLKAELRYEAADGALFPHLYGPLNPEAVLALHTLKRGADGSYKLPASL